MYQRASLVTSRPPLRLPALRVARRIPRTSPASEQARGKRRGRRGRRRTRAGLRRQRVRGARRNTSPRLRTYSASDSASTSQRSRRTSDVSASSVQFGFRRAASSRASRIASSSSVRRSSGVGDSPRCLSRIPGTYPGRPPGGCPGRVPGSRAEGHRKREQQQRRSDHQITVTWPDSTAATRQDRLRPTGCASGSAARCRRGS